MQSKWCDALIKVRGSHPYRWHNCKARPIWAIQTATGNTLEYCDRHVNHATDTQYMTTATDAALRPINR